VGFSYTTNHAEKKTDDAQTAADNHQLIQAFFERYPHLRDHPLYLMSESYGGGLQGHSHLVMCSSSDL
jgi:carboxypeptidase C (cathepsin A)